MPGPFWGHGKKLRAALLRSPHCAAADFAGRPRPADIVTMEIASKSAGSISGRARIVLPLSFGTCKMRRQREGPFAASIAGFQDFLGLPP